MKIIIDAMGGDHAPEQIVAGALQAAVRMRREQTPIGKIARWARKAAHPQYRLRVK